MAYMDMFVGSVLNANKEIYRSYAVKMEALTLKAGALSVTAYWGSDFPEGMIKPLTSAITVGPEETLVTRLVRWKSKVDRDAGWARLMSNPDLEAASTPFPVDRTRVCYGGFEELGKAQ